VIIILHLSMGTKRKYAFGMKVNNPYNNNPYNIYFIMNILKYIHNNTKIWNDPTNYVSDYN